MKHSGGACQIGATYPRYTGYTTNGGQYCRASSSTMNDLPHLVMHSGRIGAVFDAAMANDQLLMKYGSLTGLSSPSGAWKAREVYESSIPSAPVSLVATLTLDCSQSTDSRVPQNVYTLTAKPLAGERAIFASARHGHATDHVTVRNINWHTGKKHIWGIVRRE